MNPPMNSKLRDILVRLISSAVGLKLANAEDYKEFVPTAEKAIRKAVAEEMLELLPDEIVNDDAKRLRDGTFVRGDDMRRIGHNDCLRELRQKIKDWSEADTQEQSNVKESE